MKRLFLNCFFQFLVILFSCTKENGLDPVTATTMPYKESVNVFTVFPSNFDDTENLLQAFSDAKAAGPGSTVQLIFGKYFIRPIEIRDFNGYFLGYGRGITYLSNLPDIPCDDFWSNNNIPYLIQFVGGEITISDMTIRIADGCPCGRDSQINRSKFGDLLGSILILADYTSNYIPSTRSMKAVVNKVDFLAGNIKDGINPFGIRGNVNSAIYCGSPLMKFSENDELSMEDITITDCGFDKNVSGLYIWGFSESSTVDIENSVFTGNVCQNPIYACLGSKINIKNNQYIDGLYYDILIDDNDYGCYSSTSQTRSTDYTISQNYFEGAPIQASLYVIDSRHILHPDDGFNEHLDIYNNSFYTHQGGNAIVGLNIVGTNISDNYFNVYGNYGIMIEGDKISKTYASNISINGNKFDNVICSFASIYLGYFSTNCKVSCEINDKVIDNGINNSISAIESASDGDDDSKIIYKFNSLGDKFTKVNASGIIYN